MDDLDFLDDDFFSDFDRAFDLLDTNQKVKDVIQKADNAGIKLDDGNIIDLLADNIPASLNDLRTALVCAGYSSRFPKAIKIVN